MEQVLTKHHTRDSKFLEAAHLEASLEDGKAPAYVAFLIDPYRPACFWYEPVDCLRKLLLNVLLFYDQAWAYDNT